MRQYILFWKTMIVTSLTGSKRYLLWLGFLAAVIVVGLFAYAEQVRHGLVVTNMSDEVPWGAYIANFTYIVGLAAAAIMLIVPAYVYKIHSVKEVTLIGELFAVASIVMCLLFVVVDMGRPDRLWHVIPFIGRMNWPVSMLAWDVIVLNVYLLLNMHIPGYLLYMKYLGKQPNHRYYYPFVIISIFWAVSIHTVTAFLYAGLGGRPFWNSAIVAPRFLASAFAVGPCFLMIALRLVRKFTTFVFDDEVFRVLRSIIAVTLTINLFLLGCEVFKEFYSDTLHTASATYLFFGLHGHRLLVPYIWTAVVLNTAATIIYASSKIGRNDTLILIASVMAIFGIWIEKGMGLIIPGFVPSQLGQIVEYTPSWVEIRVCAAIWSAGALIFTLFLKAALPIYSGEISVRTARG